MRDFQGKEMGTKYNYYVSVSMVFHNLKLPFLPPFSRGYGKK